MKVDAVKLISGIKPAVLKGLLRKDRFDTPTAMKWLGLDEPKVTSVLRSLQKSGWIEFEGPSESIDYLAAGKQGTAADGNPPVEAYPPSRRDVRSSTA